MTTDEIRDWLRDRAGWKATHFGGWMNANGALSSDDPFPATVDGAKSAMPPDWTFERVNGEFVGTFEPVTMTVPDTGDEIHDLYVLAQHTWIVNRTARKVAHWNEND